MKKLWYSRRTFISALAIVVLAALGFLKGADVSVAIATVAVGVAGANAYESSGRKDGDWT